MERRCKLAIRERRETNSYAAQTFNPRHSDAKCSCPQASSFGEAAISGDEAFEHRHDQLHRIGGRLARLTGQHSGIGDKIAVEAGGQFHRRLDRLVIGNGAEFQLGHGQFL